MLQGQVLHHTLLFMVERDEPLHPLGQVRHRPGRPSESSRAYTCLPACLDARPTLPCPPALTHDAPHCACLFACLPAQPYDCYDNLPLNYGLPFQGATEANFLLPTAQVRRT